MLVALGVIFIPMVLDGPAGDRIERPIAIPEPPDRRFETRVLPVNPGTTTDAAATVIVSEPEPAPEQVLVAPAGRAPEMAPAPEATSAVATRSSGASGTAGTEVEQPAPAPASGGRFALQVGSFGNAANAARLVQRLGDAGWSAYQEKVAVGTSFLYRVRVRAWPDKAEAALAGERLLQQFPDLDMSVRDIGGSETEPAPLKGWMIQLGSFNSESNAQALRDRLRQGGFAAHTLDTGSAAGGRWRVRVGPELDQATAQQTRDQIRARFDLRGIIVDHP